MKKVCVAFCSALKAFRAKAGKGQIAFAKDLGLSQPVYARYEKGDREPGLDELCRIARTLDVTPNDLLGFDKSPVTSIKTGDNSPVAIGSNITQTINTPSDKRKTKK